MVSLAGSTRPVKDSQPDSSGMSKELAPVGEISGRNVRNREIQRLRRQQVAMYWFAGVCTVLTVGAILVVSYAGKDLAWLTNILLLLSPAWIITGALALLVGVGAIAMNTEIEIAAQSSAHAARLEQAWREGK
jgi:hypothetical protein